MGRMRKVAAPDGVVWSVRRRLIGPLPGSELGELFDEGDALAPYDVESTLVLGAIGAVFVVLSGVFLVPVRLIADLLGFRPCTIEARSLRGLVRLRVRGIRASARARDRLSAALAAGEDPTPLFAGFEVVGRVSPG